MLCADAKSVAGANMFKDFAQAAIDICPFGKLERRWRTVIATVPSSPLLLGGAIAPDVNQPL